MKKILIILFLIISTVSFSRGWEYNKQFRYDLEGNIQMIATLGQSQNSTFHTIGFSIVDNDYLTINVGGNYVVGSIFDVKIYVDNRKIESLRMVAANRLMLQGVASSKLVNSFRNGNEVIIAFSHSNGNSVIKVNLNGFSNNFRKIRNLKYYKFK